MRNCRSSKANRTLNTSSTIRLPKRKKPSAKSAPSSTNTSARQPGRSDCGHDPSQDPVRCFAIRCAGAPTGVDGDSGRYLSVGYGIGVLCGGGFQGGCERDGEDGDVVLLSKFLCDFGNRAGGSIADGPGSVEAEEFAMFVGGLDDSVG